MIVSKIFINSYKYDFQFAKICIASIRYWYPSIPIFLIKDVGAGNFSTELVEEKFGVQIFETSKKTFGWGYGKLEPLFLADNNSFLVMDADTVMTGPILDAVKPIAAQFIVDHEVQPVQRFNEIYYNLNRINEIDINFKYPGYSFNSGQWFGTSGIISREDFEPSLSWTDPPQPKFPEIVFNGDQAHLNFVLHRKEQLGLVSVVRRKIMIWPDANNADFLDLDMIKNGHSDYPFIIHWAGMKYKKLSDLKRYDIIAFYRNYYYLQIGRQQQKKDELYVTWLYHEKKWRFFLKRIKKRLQRK